MNANVIRGIIAGSVPALGLGAYGGYEYYKARRRREGLAGRWAADARRVLPYILGAGVVGGLGGYGAGRYYHGISSGIQGSALDRVTGFMAPHAYPALESEIDRLKKQYSDKSELFKGTGIDSMPVHTQPFTDPDLKGSVIPTEFLRTKKSSLTYGLENIITGALIKEIVDKRSAIDPGLLKGLAGGLGLSALTYGGYKALKPGIDRANSRMDKYEGIRRLAGAALPILAGAGIGTGAGYLAGRSAGNAQYDRSLAALREYDLAFQRNNSLNQNINRAVSALKLRENY